MNKNKTPFWLIAGINFAMFEGIFWYWGMKLFEYLSEPYPETPYAKYHLTKGIIGTSIATVFFGLFIFFVGKELIRQLKLMKETE